VDPDPDGSALILLSSSVADPWNIGTDPDPRIQSSDLDPDPYLWLMNPDQRSPKTYGSYGSGSATLLSRIRMIRIGNEMLIRIQEQGNWPKVLNNNK
jgi:hypothetical protein